MENIFFIILLGIVLVVGVSHVSMSSQDVTSSQTTSTIPNTTLETSHTATTATTSSRDSSSSQTTSTTPNTTSETSDTATTATTSSTHSSSSQPSSTTPNDTSKAVPIPSSTSETTPTPTNSSTMSQGTTTTYETTSTTESNFGRHGALAFSLSLSISFILLFVLIIVLFHHGYCKKTKFLSHKQRVSSLDRHDDACTVDLSSAEENTSSQKSQAGVETIQTEPTKVSQENKCEEDESATKSLTESRPDIQTSTVTDVNTGTDERPSNLQESITVPNTDHSEIKEQTEVTKADDKEMKDSDDKTDVVSSPTDELTQKTKESGAGNQEFVVVDLNSPDECSCSESREKRGDETDQPGNSNRATKIVLFPSHRKRFVTTFFKSITKCVGGKTEKSSVEENEEDKDGLELGQSENGAGLAFVNDVTSSNTADTDEIKKNELETEEKKNAGEISTDNITKTDNINKVVEDRKINPSVNAKSSEGKADDIKHTDTSEENKNDTHKSNPSAASSMAENQPTESAKASSSATSANADETKSDFQQKPDEMKKVEIKTHVITENRLASDVTSKKLEPPEFILN